MHENAYDLSWPEPKTKTRILINPIKLDIFH